MKALVAEDDLTSRQVLTKFLEPYAQCDVAADGTEALQAFIAASEAGEPYELVCLDIMMPEIDGHGVLKAIRAHEMKQGLIGSSMSKVIMITALDDSSNVIEAFKSGCEGYVVKPIEKEKLYHEMRKLGLIE